MCSTHRLILGTVEPPLWFRTRSLTSFRATFVRSSDHFSAHKASVIETHFAATSVHVTSRVLHCEASLSFIADLEFNHIDCLTLWRPQRTLTFNFGAQNKYDDWGFYCTEFISLSCTKLPTTSNPLSGCFLTPSLWHPGLYHDGITVLWNVKVTAYEGARDEREKRKRGGKGHVFMSDGAGLCCWCCWIWGSRSKFSWNLPV